MVRTIATAQPSGRKRRRNERDPEATCSIGKSQPSSTFPRISSAPPRSSSTPAFFHNASHGGSQANVVKATPSSPLQRNAPVSDADLEAMITTLSLIYKHGYGSEPGKPSIRCRTAGSCRRGRRGNATVEGCFSSRGSALKGRGTSSGNRSNKDSREVSSSRSPCRPWTAPSSSVTELGRPLEHNESKEEPVSEAVLVPSAIAREDFERSKARKESSRSARTLLSQLGPTIRREDFVSAAHLLKSAREKFHAAGNRNGVVEVDASMTKIKADLVVKAIKAAREAREYDRMKELMFEAQHYFAILARLGRIQRHDALCKSERREADRRTYEGFLHPHRLCRNNALEDGRSSWQAALRLARKRKYAEARSRLIDARRCFKWAGGAEKDVKELERVEEELEFRENSARRDHLIESMTNNVQFLSPKDYGELFAKLSEAATAYGVVRDDEGAQVVSAVTAGLQAVRSAEESWLALMEALKERRYPSASQHLRDATRSVLDATRGLPVVSPSLARAAEILSPAGGVSPSDIIAELAVLDGLRDHEESIRLLNEGLLDKAQERNTSAREVLEYTARSCCELSVDNDSDNGEMVDRGQVGADKAKECDSKRVMEPTSGEHGSLRLSCSKGGECTAADGGAAREQQVLLAGERNTPGEAIWIDQPFALSDEQLREGEALLLRILQLTPASTGDDGNAFEPRWSTASTNSSVRDRVEDILDDIFVKQDIITCHKELERGDKLMSLFWEIVAASGARTSPEKSKSVSCDESGHGSRKSDEDAIISAGAPDNVQFREEVSGILGDKLSAEAAEKCLRLLMEATEAYEGQGFEKQAGHAIRLQAGIVADRCLARALALAQTNKAIAGDESGDEAAQPEGVGKPTTSSIATAAHLGLTSRGYHGFRSMEAFEAARAAACEAEANYARAENAEGALRARRILMSLKGDEAMVDAVSVLQQRKYVEALQAMCRASGFYIDAGPEGEEGLCRVRDPERLVEAIALEDGLRLKGEAVRLLRDGDVETATYIRGQAQRCFSFVDSDGLADATVDVETAAHMVTRLADGDVAAADAEEALECGEIGRAIALLREAKSLYRKAQLCYEELVDKVTGLIKSWPNDHEASLKAIELQDNINTIYDSRVDGKRVARVESCLDCLAADESLEGLAQVVDCEQFEDAHALLSSSAKVYERSADHLHISKVKRIISLVGMVEKAIQALNIGHYEEAEQLILESLRVRSALTSKRPISLRPPDCKLLQGGESGAKASLWARVRKAGEADGSDAFKLMERGDYNAAEVAATSASSRFEWCASHVDYASPDDAEEAFDMCAAALREVEELKAKMSEALGKVETEGTVQEGTMKKAQEDFKAAVNALRAAAGLFRSAGLGEKSTIAKAETKLTQGEAWIVTAEALHDSGDPEASIEHLRRARTLLLEAAEIADTTAAEQLTDLVHPTNSRDVGTTNVSTATGLEDVPEKIELFQPHIAGHITIPGVLRAQDALDYYKALCLMIAAEKYYDTVVMEEWWTSAVTVCEGKSAETIAAPVMAGAPVEFERTSADIAETSTVPEQKSSDADGVVVAHQHLWSECHGSAFDIDSEGIVEGVKGDKAPGRVETQGIVQEGTTKKAQGDFQQAVNILRAAAGLFRSARLGERSTTAKAKMKRRKMFKCFQLCRAADDICRRLANLLQEKQMDRAKGDLKEALDMYRQGEAFEKFADTQVVAFCVERENALCCDFVSTIVTGDPATAEKVLEESRPLFRKTAEIKSEVLQDVAVIMAAKHRHIETLIAFCRVWAKHLSSLTPATTVTEDDPNPACTLDAILSSICRLSTSEADMLNVSLDVLGCACAGVVDTPTPSEPETSDPDGVSNAYQRQPSGRHGSTNSIDAEGTVGGVKGDKAPSELEAEGTVQEGGIQKAQGGFKEALHDLRAAAGLFRSAGLGERSATAKAKAKLTQAEAWMITAEALHDSGDIEVSVEHLRRGKTLLLEAAEIGDATATGKSVNFVYPINSGDFGTINVSAASRLEKLLEKYKYFQSRLTGDITIHGVQPVLDFLDYYEALRLMLEAEGHYTTVKIENRLTSAGMAYEEESAGTITKPVSAETTALPPRDTTNEKETNLAKTEGLLSKTVENIVCADHSLAAEPTVEQFDHKSTVDTTAVSTKAGGFENNAIISKTEEGLERTRNIDSTVDNAHSGSSGPAFEGEGHRLALATPAGDSKSAGKGCEAWESIKMFLSSDITMGNGHKRHVMGHEAAASKEEDSGSNNVDYDFEADNGVVLRTASNTPVGENAVMLRKCGDYYDTTAAEQPADLVNLPNSGDVGTINASAKTKLEKLLVKNKVCQSRLAGVITVREVLLALRALDYYEALRLMLEVERHHDTAKMEEWLAPALNAHGEEGAGTIAGPVSDGATVELDLTCASIADTSTPHENRVTTSKIKEGLARARNGVTTGDTAGFGTGGPAPKGIDGRLSSTTPVGDIESAGQGYEAGESIVSTLSGPSESSIASKITRENGPKHTPMEHGPGRPEQGDASSYDLYDDFLADSGVVSRTASVTPACVNTVKLMERRVYESAEVVAAPASARFEWCASHAYYASPDAAEGATGVRTAALRKVEDRKVKMSKAPSEMEAEGTVQERGIQKAQGDFQEAVNALRTVAGLFPSMELGERTATAKAKAKLTQAEAWMITAEGLHDSGDLEASAEHLRRGRTLLLEAAEIGDATAVESPADLVYPTNSRDAGTSNASAKTRLETLLLKNEFFQSRLAGDITVRGVLPALRALDYYEALRLMLEAEGYYAAVKMETRLAPAVMTYSEEGAGTIAGPLSDGATMELDLTCAGLANTSTPSENRVAASKIEKGLARSCNDVAAEDTAGFGTGGPALKGINARLSPTTPIGDIESAGQGYEAGESSVSTLSGPNESYLVPKITRGNGSKQHPMKHDPGRPEQGDAGSYNLEDDFEADSGVESRTTSISFTTKTASKSDNYSSDWQHDSEFGGVESSGTLYTKNVSQLQRNPGDERFSPWDISKPADDGSQSIAGNTRSSSGLGSGGREETQMDSLDGTNYYSGSNSRRRSRYDSDGDSIDYASADGRTRGERSSQHLPFTIPGTPRGARVRWNLEAKRRPSYTMNTS